MRKTMSLKSSPMPLSKGSPGEVPQSNISNVHSGIGPGVSSPVSRSEGRGSGRSQRNFRQGYGNNSKLSGKTTTTQVARDFQVSENDELCLRNTRKSNISHLLNFQYGYSTRYRDVPESYVYRQNRPNANFKQGKIIDKQKFLHANSKVVIRSCNKWIPESPDSPVSWSDVVQVQLFSTEMPFCPICLEAPLAAKITNCGHVYCHHCVLHLLAVAEKRWAQCPICFEGVREADLRNVTALRFNQYVIGDTITLQLMRRKKNIQIPYVSCEPPIESNRAQKLADSETTSKFSKLLSCTPEEELEMILKPNLYALDTKIEQENDEYEVQYLKAAKECLSLEIIALETSLLSKSDTYDSNADFTGEAYAKSDETEYLFYQSQEGQLIFASPFTTKMLLKEFGDMENCPPQIFGKIAELSEARVDEDFRFSHRFLSHLPLGSVVLFCEIILQPPLVSRQTLKFFAGEINDKRIALEKKKRDERKREKRISKVMEEQMYPGTGAVSAAPRVNLSIDNFPAFESSSSPESGTAPLVEPSTSTLGIESPEGASAWPIESNRPSFASAVFSASPESNDNSFARIASWPATTQNSTSRSSHNRVVSNALIDLGDSIEDSPELVTPTFNQAFSMAFDQALTLGGQSSDVAAGSKASGGGKRGKKRGGKAKPQLLFSNSMSFTNT